jgi:hypothetical protein
MVAQRIWSIGKFEKRDNLVSIFLPQPNSIARKKQIKPGHLIRLNLGIFVLTKKLRSTGLILLQQYYTKSVMDLESMVF